MMGYPTFPNEQKSVSINSNLSALKIALGFAYDGAIRARCYSDERLIAELAEVLAQINKSLLIHTQIRREILGPRSSLHVVKGTDE